jgi:hypothetical protein
MNTLNFQILKPMRSALAVVLFGAAALSPFAAATAAEQVQQSGPVSFVSGGVDDASLDRMKSMVPGFNLKMVFALNSGAFLSDVNVTVADARGNRIMQTKTEGPWLLAKLPAGTYQVVATEGGNAIKRTVTVGSGKASDLEFRWASE